MNGRRSHPKHAPPTCCEARATPVVRSPSENISSADEYSWLPLCSYSLAQIADWFALRGDLIGMAHPCSNAGRKKTATRNQFETFCESEQSAASVGPNFRD